jgi:hypothetical protein
MSCAVLPLLCRRANSSAQAKLGQELESLSHACLAIVTVIVPRVSLLIIKLLYGGKPQTGFSLNILAHIADTVDRFDAEK